MVLTMNENKKIIYCIFQALLLFVFFIPCACSDDSATVAQQREKFAIACAGIYEYQYYTGGFDSTLLMFKREMMGQLVYNNVNSPHHGDKEYFEGQVKQAYGDLMALPEVHKKTYQHDQWILKPALCDEIAATIFILISSKEWSEGCNKELSQSHAILSDIYPWDNENFSILKKDLDNEYLFVMKKRNQVKQ